jgi:oligopeptide/dipeptide ABC transporter ATP-binding protein
VKKLIEIKNLCTYYYTDDGIVKALDNVSLDLYPGEAVGIVGESGCGKTTLGLSIMRLIRSPGRIVEGEILFQDENILKMDQEKVRKLRGGNVAMIFQDPMSSLNPVFNIGNQIEETIKLHQEITSNTELTEKVLEILFKVGISDPEQRLREYPHQFSGGMRQRVMIAMALSCNPNLLIADEPTTSLDVTIQAQILDLMTKLKQDFQSAILLITHNVAVVAEFCDRAAVMYGGKIVEYSDIINIFKNPKHPYTKALLGSVPRVDSTLDELVSIPGEVPSLIDPPAGCIFHPRCSYEREKCRIIIPELLNVGSNHKVACLLYEKTDRGQKDE